MEYNEIQRIAETHVCGSCGGNLIVMQKPDSDTHRCEYYLRCVNNCDVGKSGYIRIKSYTEIYKEGGVLPIHVQNIIERKVRKGMTTAEKTTAVVKHMPEETRTAIANYLGGFLFNGKAPESKEINKALALTKWGFEPQLHMSIYQGKLHIEKGGWWWWAGQDKRFDRIVSQALTTKDEREAYGVRAGEIGVVAKLYIKGGKEPYCTGFGRASTNASTPVIRGSAVESAHPYLLAEKRAEVQAIKKFRPLGEPPDVTPEEMEAARAIFSSEAGEPEVIETTARDISDAAEIPPSDAKLPASGVDIPAAEETPTEGDINPFPKLSAKYGEDMLGFCWEHGEGWTLNQWNKRTHRTDEGWCNFRDILKPITEEICTAGIVDGLALNDKVKKQYDGRTWSKLSEEEQLTVLEGLLS